MIPFLICDWGCFPEKKWWPRWLAVDSSWCDAVPFDGLKLTCDHKTADVGSRWIRFNTTELTYSQLHSGELTWQWKMGRFKLRFLLKIGGYILVYQRVDEVSKKSFGWHDHSLREVAAGNLFFIPWQAGAVLGTLSIFNHQFCCQSSI